MPSLQLFVDTTARQLCQGFTNTLPAVIPPVAITDSLNLTVTFLAQTGVSSAPYSYVNMAASTLKALMGVICGIPTYGTFRLTDGVTNSAPINYNDGQVVVQGDISSISSWTSPTVTGPLGGPWTITNGINGALPALQSTLNTLAPASTVLITQQAAGTSTTPAVNIVRLVTLPVAKQVTWTIAGTPTYSFSGLLTPDPVALQQTMGTLLTQTYSFMLQTTTSGDVETYVSTKITIDNTVSG